MTRRKAAKERDTQLKKRELIKAYMLTLLKELKKKKKPKPVQQEEKLMREFDPEGKPVN